MTALEIFLLFAGAACIVVSFVMPAHTEKKQNTSIEPELSEFQLEAIRNKVEEAVEQEVENVVEKTEISLDKISNTKILEMQEYANTIFSEMNRNHSETMFLYDMLNDKSKDIKSIVRELTLLKQNDGTQAGAQMAELENLSEHDVSGKQIMEKLFIQAAQEEADTTQQQLEEALKETAATTVKRTTRKTAEKTTTDTKEKTTKTVKKADAPEETDGDEGTTAKKTTTAKKAASGKGKTRKPEEKTDINSQILAMYRDGKSVLEIARELNLGVGQTKLVIDLFEGKI